MARDGDQPASRTPAKPAWVLRPAALVRAVVEWVRQEPLKRAPVAALPVAAIVGGLIGWIFWGGASPPAEVTLPQLQQALETEDFREAQVIAEQLQVQPTTQAASQGLLLYVRGVRLAHEAAGRFDESERRGLYRVAAGYLQQSRDLGLPGELHDRVFLQTAKCLHDAARYAAAARFLKEGLDAGAPATADVHRMLAMCYARLPNPETGEALRHLDVYLRDKRLSPADRQTATLERIDLLLKLERDEEAQKTLAPLMEEKTPFASRAMLLQAKLFVRTAEGLAAQPNANSAAPLTEARRILEKIRQDEAIDRPERRQADYLYGVCLRASDDLPGALKQFSAVRRLYAGTPSGLSAGLGEAEMLQHLGQDAEALESYRRLLSETPPPADYSNPWISLEGFRARLLAGYARWLGQQRYVEALALCKALPPVFSPDRAMLLQAEARTDWASRLKAQAAGLSRREVQAAEQEARRQLRLAGVAYARLALLRRTSREYPDDLWRSAECYLRGRDFRHAARMFQLYLDQDDLRRRADAQLHLGEALMSLGELEQARETFHVVLEAHPQHPATYRARLLAAQTHLELNDAAAAKKLLRENLENESLTPQSLEWRDSLFLLGAALFREGKVFEAESRQLGVDSVNTEARKPGLAKLQQCNEACRDAVRAFEEALARYPEAPQSLRAWYYLAELHREAAKYARKRLSTITLDATRNAVEREMQEKLASAVAAYGELIERLTRREKTEELNAAAAAPLSQLEHGMLRNAYFGRADALFDLGRYEEAIRAYTLAANRYQNEPAALEAFLQIAGCHRRLRRSAEARGVLEQAKVVLGRIPPEADFVRTTRYGRKQWEELLELLIVN